MAPILYMEEFQVPLKHFGFYQGALSLVFAICSIVSPSILGTFGKEKCFQFGKWCCILGAIFTLAIIPLGLTRPLIVTAIMLLFALGAVFPINIMYPLALDIVKDSKARSAALIWSVRLVVTAILLEGVSYFYTGSFTPVGITIAAAILIAFVITQRLLKKKSLIFE
jgi:DHA1 family bicyclomycin/chloramphenicol resistance-like MFS transporter